MNTAWTKPSIVEVPLGAEINSYVCGKREDEFGAITEDTPGG